MTEGMPPKIDPETLVLRARPRRAIRFKRHLLVSGVAIVSVVLLGMTWLALQQSTSKSASAGTELYDPDKAANAQKPKPDAWQALPTTYADASAGVPQLGPPLPGDLGHPLLEAKASPPVAASGPGEQAGGLAPAAGVFFQVKASGAAAPASPDAVPVGPNLAMAEPPIALKTGLGDDPNGQGQKLDFVSAARTGGVTSPHILQAPPSPYTVMAGTVISANLVTGLDSDLPGMVIAQVSDSVFDSVSGDILLIPQGSRLIGAYDSVVAFGQSRALLVWQRLILPDGTSLEIDNLPATDPSGYSGLSDTIDYHTWSLIKGVGLSTLLGLTAIGGSSEESDLVKALRQSTQQTANQTGQKIVDKTLNIQPTLTVRPGWPLRVIVHKDLVLQPYKL